MVVRINACIFEGFELFDTCDTITRNQIKIRKFRFNSTRCFANKGEFFII